MLDSVDKRTLGLGYLVGTGLSLMLGLFAYSLLTFETFPVALIGTTAAVLLTATLPVVGYWLYRGPLPNESIWRIATYSALGIGVSTTLAVGIIFVRTQYPTISMFPSLLVNNIAAGAVLGVLVGAVTELRARYEETVELNQHNSVMNRVLRHDIRNSMTMIIGYADHVASGNGVDDQTATKIKNKAYDVVRLGNTARNIEAILEEESGGSVDVARVVESELDRLRAEYPTASFSTDLPEDVSIAVNELFTFVVRNLLETAYEKAGAVSTLHVAVRVASLRRNTFSIQLRADGIGVDDWETSVVVEPTETDLRHDDGLDLWLVKWFTDHYGETIDLQSDDSRGDAVRLELLADEIETTADDQGILERFPVIR